MQYINLLPFIHDKIIKNLLVTYKIKYLQKTLKNKYNNFYGQLYLLKPDFKQLKAHTALKLSSTINGIGMSLEHK